MLDYIYGHDEAVAQFAAQLIPHCRDRGFGRCKAIGVAQDGSLIAGLVFHNYDPQAEIIEISGAALPRTRWLTRETLARMYQYPFLTCGCQMVLKRVSATNERLLRILAAYGHSFIPVPRMFGRYHDGVLATLTVEDWADNKFNKRLAHHVQHEQREAA